MQFHKRNGVVLKGIFFCAKILLQTKIYPPYAYFLGEIFKIIFPENLFSIFKNTAKIFDRGHHSILSRRNHFRNVSEFSSDFHEILSEK